MTVAASNHGRSMPDRGVEYSVVIPTYRGALNLPELMGRLTEVMNALRTTYEIILVDDDSPDASWDVVRRLSNIHPSLRAIRLMKNVGQFRALMCGLERVRGDFVVTMDDDLQNPPEEIPKLVAAMRDHPEMDGIIAAYASKEHGLWRAMGSRMVRIINRVVSDKPASLKTTSFRLLRRGLVDAIARHQTMNPVMGPLVVQNSRMLMNVTVAHHARRKGTSNYNLLGLINLTLDHILNFSSLPLKFVAVVGMSSSALSICIGVYYLFHFLTTNVSVAVQGWTTLVLMLAFFSGMILFSIGLMGEYFIRILKEVSHAPRYVVREEI